MGGAGAWGAAGNLRRSLLSTIMVAKIRAPMRRRSFAGMKILCVSDLHARTAWYKWLVSESAHYDIVCLSGDLLNLGDYDADPLEQAAAVLPYLRAIKQRTSLAICSGNHDVLPQRGFYSAEWMQPLRDEGIYVDGDSFWCSDYRFRCVPWCDPVPENTADDFWLMHAPPFGIATSTVAGGVSRGCEDLRALCLSGDAPQWILSGHIHSPLGHWSQIGRSMSLNPGRGLDGAIPNHIVIDLARRRVTHQRRMSSAFRVTGFSY